MSVVLVVEDDPSILSGLAMNLELEGHSVLTAPDGVEGLRQMQLHRPDLVILDLMLPRMSGFEMCRKARENSFATPILILTARGQEGDRVRGLDAGADDYVSKPFSLPELLARVRALLRRVARSDKNDALEQLSIGDISVDFRHFTASKAGVRVDLTRKEFGLLQELATHPGEVLTRDHLLNKVWGYESYPSTRTVDNHVLALRNKLRLQAIETVHGVGYRWVQP